MTAPAPHRLMTAEEFFEFNQQSDVRYELVAGVPYAMTGTTLRHTTITGNIYAALRTAAAGGPCRAFFNDVGVRVPNGNIYYPDVVVTCVPVNERKLLVPDPCLIVEVISPNTASTDRREKLPEYCKLPSARAVLIVEQRRRRVEHHWRADDGQWWHREVHAEGDTSIDVPCPPTALTFDTIYADTTPDPPYPDEIRHLRIGEADAEEYIARLAATGA